MNRTETKTMLPFRRFSLADRDVYEPFMTDAGERGCEFSFANLYLWGRQHFTEYGDHIVLFSQFDRKSVYPYPVGEGDKKAVLDAIIDDAHARGIPCRITGLTQNAKETLESLYPGQFRYHCDRNSFDYVYDIHDLADLKGKKYHGKRNHLNRFREAYPDFTVEPLNESNMEAARTMVADWYRARLLENPDGDYHMEQAAMEKAFRDYGKLGMEGMLLRNGEDVLGVTLGSFLSEDTVDVHFEKARADIQGAYAAINCEFARYLRDKYPAVRYLNREDDMGLEGLRKAKLSYYPHHMVEKCWACLLEDGYDY